MKGDFAILLLSTSAAYRPHDLAGVANRPSNPSPPIFNGKIFQSQKLKQRFNQIFKRRTGFASLDRLLARLFANKKELLRVLDRPKTPLHTNATENDIRCQVTRRKISGTTRSDDGKECRDAFLSIFKTCRKLAISFWEYLGTRLGAAVTNPVPPLPKIVTDRCAPA